MEDSAADSHCDTSECESNYKLYCSVHTQFIGTKGAFSNHSKCNVSGLVDFQTGSEYFDLLFKYVGSNISNIEELKSQATSKDVAEIDMMLEHADKLTQEMGEIDQSSSNRDGTLLYFNGNQFKVEAEGLIEEITTQMKVKEENLKIRQEKLVKAKAPTSCIKVPSEPNRTNMTIFKILIIGDEKTGKSSILKRYVDNEFSNFYDLTIGVEFGGVQMKADDTYVKLQIWDTAGQQTFRSITYSYYRGAHIIFITYDITDKKTFDNLNEYFDKITQHGSDPVIKVLVGNKSDLEHERQVTPDMAMKIGEKYNIDYCIEVSGKSNINIDKLFEDATILRLEIHKDIV